MLRRLEADTWNPNNLKRNTKMTEIHRAGTDCVWAGEEQLFAEGAICLPVFNSVTFGYEDMDEDYTKIDERVKDRLRKECLQAMNAYIKESVDWAVALHKKGMEEAARSDRPTKTGELVM